MLTTPETKPPATRSSRRWLARLVPAGLIAAAVGLVGLVASLPAPERTRTPPEPVPVNVRTMRIEPVPELVDTLTLIAVVEPQYVVRVAAEVPGRIEAIGTRVSPAVFHGRTLPAGSPLAEGQPVAAGDVLVQLNRDLLAARHQGAQAQFEYDEREYLRLLDLHERGTTSKTELDNARTRLEVSRAARDQAARELERTTIRAPCDGILNDLTMEVGEYAAPGDVVAEIVNIDTVKMAVDVPERDVSRLALGDRATVVIAAEDGATVEGVITYISALADEVTRTTRIELTVPNPGHRLRSGQIVHARLTRQVLTDVILIPLDAVIPLEDGRLVYTVRDGRAARCDVELGLIQGRSVQVLRGLAPGDELIVVGHRYVGPGQPVRVLGPADPAAGPAARLSAAEDVP